MLRALEAGTAGLHAHGHGAFPTSTSDALTSGCIAGAVECMVKHLRTPAAWNPNAFYSRWRQLKMAPECRCRLSWLA
jgi:hypothetical protein